MLLTVTCGSTVLSRAPPQEPPDPEEPKCIRIFERSSSGTERFSELKYDNPLPGKQFCLPRVVGTELDVKGTKPAKRD